MAYLRGKVEAIISLNKSNCYFLKTGKCSLNAVGNFYASDVVMLPQDDLLYCPRLLESMRRADRATTVSVVPCECGHAQVISGHQRACIAEQKGLEIEFVSAESETKAGCSLCEGQMSFENNSGVRIVTVQARIKSGNEASDGEKNGSDRK